MTDSVLRTEPWRKWCASHLVNLKARRALISQAKRDQTFAKDLLEACRTDILFFFNFFLWTYDPRRQGDKVVPFVTWPFQDDSILLTQTSIREGRGLLTEKSRDMGATYIKTGVIDHFFIFSNDTSFLFLSRKEDLVEKSGDPDTLMGKIDLYHDHLPSFFNLSVEQKQLHRKNNRNGSLISGESTNADAGRGGRRTGVLADEFASVPNGSEVHAAVRSNTSCFMPISTPKGRGNEFHNIRQNPHFPKERIHWSVHPYKQVGLYTAKNGRLEVLDKGYKFPDDYPFLLDGKVRSPWYDREEREIGHPAIVAQELDIDYLGSNSQYFDAELIDRFLSSVCRPPVVRGELLGGRFVESPHGRWAFWVRVAPTGIPDLMDVLAGGGNPFFVSGDIAQGTGASNSVLSVGHGPTRRKIGEFCNSTIRPEELADLALAMVQWLGNGMLGWEGNGPGRTFGQRVVESGYGRILYREQNGKSTPLPGWWSGTETKGVLFGEYRRGLNSGDYTTYCKEEIQECGDYIFEPSGGIAHMAQGNAEDPSGAAANHGDRVVSSALLWHMMRQKHAPAKTTLEKTSVPMHSVAWFLEQDQKRRATKGFY